MYKKLLLLCFALIAFSTPQSASAHVVVADTTGQTGLILHINPDDDPVAGKPSTLFFDIQNKTITGKTHSFVLTAATVDRPPMTLPITVSGSSVITTYTFPAQGVYTLKLAAYSRTTEHVVTFIYSQRLERGVQGIDNASGMSHAWAEIGIIASICSFIALAIIGFNKRKDIAKYSK
jgi:hypothetical protein